MENIVQSFKGDHRVIGFGTTEEAAYYERFGPDFKVDVDVWGVIDDELNPNTSTEEVSDLKEEDNRVVEAFIAEYKDIRGGTTPEGEKHYRDLAQKSLEKGSVVIRLVVQLDTPKPEEKLPRLKNCVEAVQQADKPKRNITSGLKLNSKYL